MQAAGSAQPCLRTRHRNTGLSQIIDKGLPGIAFRCRMQRSQRLRGVSGGGDPALAENPFKKTQPCSRRRVIARQVQPFQSVQDMCSAHLFILPDRTPGRLGRWRCFGVARLSPDTRPRHPPQLDKYPRLVSGLGGSGCRTFPGRAGPVASCDIPRSLPLRGQRRLLTGFPILPCRVCAHQRHLGIPVFRNRAQGARLQAPCTCSNAAGSEIVGIA